MLKASAFLTRGPQRGRDGTHKSVGLVLGVLIILMIGLIGFALHLVLAKNPRPSTVAPVWLEATGATSVSVLDLDAGSIHNFTEREIWNWMAGHQADLILDLPTANTSLGATGGRAPPTKQSRPGTWPTGAGLVVTHGHDGAWPSRSHVEGAGFMPASGSRAGSREARTHS